MLNEIKTSKSSAIGEKLSKYLIVKPIIISKYKLWVDQASEFYNRTFDKLLKSININIYHTFNKGKAVVVERFNRTLKIIV